jgi:hypothetical protein
MLESINVRFFCFEQIDDPFETVDLVEIKHAEFVDLYAIAPSARVDIEKHSIFDNGCRQLCVTINAERETGAEV